MAGTIKGMTIEIGGNTAPLEEALKSTNKEIKNTQKELNEVNKLLKLDPTNTELLKQKQQLLGQQIGQTTTKLDALKQAQAQLDAEIKKGGNVNQEEYRKLEREIASAEGSLKKLKEEAKNCNPNLAKLKEGLKQVGEGAITATTALVDFTVKGVKAMAVACTGAVTALGSLAIKAGQTADELNTLASTTGLSTKQLQEFQYASELIDVDMSTLTSALKKTTSAMVSAKDGTGASADAFKKLGVSVTDAQGNLRDNNDVFNEAIKALGNVANETERDALAMQLFGKSATELNPLIEGGIDTLAEMATQANDLGLVLSQDALDGANAFNDQLDILKANGKGLFNVIGTEIASELTPAMESLNGYTMEIIKSLTGALSSGGIEGFVKELSNQLGKLISDITAYLPKIAKLGVDIIKTLIGSIKENAESMGSAGAELLTTLIEGFYEILPDLVETAIILVTSFIQTFGEKLPELIPIITEGLLGVADAIVDNIDLIIDGALQLFLGLVAGLEKALPRLVEKLPEIIEKVVTALIENLPTIIEAIGTIIISIANALGESVDVLIPAIVTTILNLVDCIIENLPTIIETIVTVVMAIADALIDNIDLLIDSAIQLIVGLAQGLVDALPKLVERLPEIMIALCEGLLSLAWKLGEVAVKLIESLGSALSNGVSGLWEAITNLWEYMRNALMEKVKGAIEIGKNIVEGIWNGIKNAKDWLWNKLKEWCGSVLDGIKAWFGIESPSKVFADEVGKYMAQGIGVGFNNTLPSVVSTMQSKLSTLTDAMQTELSFGDIPQIQGNQIISENSYVTRNYTNTIETVRQPQTVELVLDGTKLARAMIQPLDNEYNRLGVTI